MLDAHPIEPGWMSWLIAGAWAAVILATVPLAPWVTGVVAGSVGDGMFLWFTAIAFGAALIVSLRTLSRRALPTGARLWLLFCGAMLLWLTWRLRDIPVEAMHLIQYGVLSLLIYRALLRHRPDVTIYPLSALLAGIVGVLDEWLQWLMPGRYWGIGDVALNLTAALLIQAALAAGLRPTVVHSRPSSAGVRHLTWAVAIFLLMITASYANTPDRIAAYAVRLPGLGFLMDNQSMMIEYGYLHEDPRAGVFRSRFDSASLRRLDAERGAEAGRILESYRTDADWERFRSIYTVPRDPYVHEAGTHLFRRNRHLDLARDPERPLWRRGDSYFIASRENRILERHFSRVVKGSSHRWTEAIHREVEAGARMHNDYESPVSRHIVTAVTREQVVGGLLLATAIVFMTGLTGSRRMTRVDRSGSGRH